MKTGEEGERGQNGWKRTQQMDMDTKECQGRNGWLMMEWMIKDSSQGGHECYLRLNGQYFQEKTRQG